MQIAALTDPYELPRHQEYHFMKGKSIGARLVPLSVAFIVSLFILCLHLLFSKISQPLSIDKGWFLLTCIWTNNGLLEITQKLIQNIKESELGYFQSLLIALPVLSVLWIFRTRDTTENLYFNNFSQGVGLLKDIKNIHAIETGVTLLIELSEQTKTYNGSIEKSFLSLLRADIGEKSEDIRRGRRIYAQYVLKWLNGDGDGISKLETNGITLSNQEFNLSIEGVAPAFEMLNKKLFQKAELTKHWRSEPSHLLTSKEKWWIRYKDEVDRDFIYFKSEVSERGAVIWYEPSDAISFPVAILNSDLKNEYTELLKMVGIELGEQVRDLGDEQRKRIALQYKSPESSSQNIKDRCKAFRDWVKKVPSMLCIFCKSSLKSLMNIILCQTKSVFGRFAWLAAVSLLSLSLYLFFTNATSLWDAGIQSLLTDIIAKRFKLEPFQILLIALPIAIVLWIFRTRDTTENLYFNNFSQGVGLLKDIKNIHAIETGVTLLIELSEQTKTYNGSIEKSFLSLLRADIGEKSKDITKGRRAYAQYILKWLNGGDGRINKLDTDGITLSNQEFNLSIEGVALAFKRLNEKLFQKANVPHNIAKRSSGLILADKWYIRHKNAKDNDFIYFIPITSDRGVVICYEPPNPILFPRSTLNPYVLDSHVKPWKEYTAVLEKVGIELETTLLTRLLSTRHVVKKV